MTFRCSIPIVQRSSFNSPAIVLTDFLYSLVESTSVDMHYSNDCECENSNSKPLGAVQLHSTLSLLCKHEFDLVFSVSPTDGAKESN
jgi:hypothetical protein